MMQQRALEAMASGTQERARDRRATARRLIGELAPHRSRLAAALALVLLGAATQATGPFIIGQAIDRAIVPGRRGALAAWMIALAVTAVIGALASRAQTRQIGEIGQRVLAGLRGRIFARLQRLPLVYFDRRPVGDLISRVVNDVDTLNQFISQGVSQVLGQLFGLVGIVIVMLALDWKLALVSFAMLPVMLLITNLFASRARNAFRRTRQTVGDVTAGLQEEIVGVRQAQAFNRTERNIERFRERNEANRQANVQATGITSAFAPAIDVLSTLATALVVGVGGWLVYQDGMTVGTLAAFLIYIQQFFRPIQLISQVYTQAQASLAGAERIYMIEDEAPEPADVQGAKVLDQIAGEIAFDGVAFAYTEERDVLRDVNFRVAPGQTVALVGRTGAGKTTIASLIPRFYDVTAGSVRIDGHDVREVTRTSLRRQIAVVLQEAFLFSGTIAENIRYGRLEATQEEIEAAARAVDAHDFIARLPQAYETPLGEGGGNLSQGQRQLLAFARALLAAPRILILDEATANIDTRTEATIQRALATILAGRTSIIIAHRLSTIRNADLILVIEEGAIAERGTHAELLERDGLYAALYRRQFREVQRAAAAD
jgi:ATP-binding cassette subfamily B protein/subfamily B ATP-binding cassette protein MsbA